MQEYWEIYMKNIEEKPASIQFNAGISMDVEDIQYLQSKALKSMMN